jgi:hypothetical protein
VLGSLWRACARLVAPVVGAVLALYEGASAALNAGRHRDRGARRRAARYAGLLPLAVAMLAWAAPSAVAASAWQIDALANSPAAPGADLTYLVEIRNGGDVDLDGSTEVISFTGTLPPGLTIARVNPASNLDCSSLVPGSQTFTCQHTGLITTQAHSVSNNTRAFVVHVTVDGNASGVLTSRFSVMGGDASDGDPTTPSASTVAPVTVTTAPPAFGIAAFDAQVVADTAGTPFTQAAGHPFEATTWIDFNAHSNPDPLKGDLTPIEPPKDVIVDLPPGFFGDPSGASQCTLSQLSNAILGDGQPLCAPTSQVGTTTVRLNGRPARLLFGPVAVYNMVPSPNAPVRLGFNVLGTVVTLDANVRSASDYGVTATVRNISEGVGIAGTNVTLWGVPSDPVHDPDRACPGASGPWQGGPSCTSGAPRSAFLRNPTSCPDPSVGLPTTLRTDSWVHPGVFTQATTLSHRPNGYPFAPMDWGPQQGVTGCESVPFDPTLSATPANTAAGAPTGYAFDVGLPQSSDPNTIGESDLRDTVVTMPPGVQFSTSATDGLQGCAPSEIKLHSEEGAACPPGSKLGTVTITTPALPNPLQGAVYLASPHDNPFNNLIALYLVARGSGVTVKLPARVDLDPLTGQVTTTIENAPQTPFSNVHLQFKDGSRAPLVNPRACGPYTTTAMLTGWSGKVVSSGSSFTVSQDGHGAPCGGPKFSPGFSAGTENPAAARSSTFHVRLTRDDTDEELAGLRLDMPDGLLGYISKVTLCSESDANAGSCSDASKIGSVAVGAGAGPDPFYITNGRLYLTGPYKGAPFGLEVVVPAVAGPFNLGDVIVRQSIFVDKHNATLRIISDPLPTILQGVRIGVRDVRVAIDRPGFFLNPTSCAEKHIGGEIDSAIGQTAAVSERFQAAECQGLPLKPRMVLSVGSKGHTGMNAVTPFTTVLTQTPGQSNLRSVKVSLPTTLNARLNIVNRACTRAQFEAGNCRQAQAGSAIARTPLLRGPLTGGVYFVRNGKPLPDLFVALRGQVSFDLIGRVTIPGGTHLATTFNAVPDVPITSFELRLVSGSHGPVGAATNLCTTRGRTATASVDYVGQNGKTLHVAPRVKIVGCPRTSHHKAARRRRTH